MTSDGFATFAPVSVPKGESVLSATYFGEGPCGATHAAVPYSVWGSDPVAPSVGPLNAFSRKPKVEGGKVYAFESETAGEFFNKDYILKLLDDHRSGRGKNMKRVWSVYCFILWYERYFK